MGAIISLGREEFGMSFDDSVRECIRQKLDNLSESTQVSLELVNILYGKGLISDDEHQVLEVLILFVQFILNKAFNYPNLFNHASHHFVFNTLSLGASCYTCGIKHLHLESWNSP